MLVPRTKTTMTPMLPSTPEEGTTRVQTSATEEAMCQAIALSERPNRTPQTRLAKKYVIRLQAMHTRRAILASELVGLEFEVHACTAQTCCCNSDQGPHNGDPLPHPANTLQRYPLSCECPTQKTTHYKGNKKGFIALPMKCKSSTLPWHLISPHASWTADAAHSVKHRQKNNTAVGASAVNARYLPTQTNGSVLSESW
jgi:hypothetical protein